MYEGFDFVWRNGLKPYLITPQQKIVVLDVNGDIPYLRPGDPLCQPREPDEEYPLLSSVNRGQNEVTSVPAQADDSAVQPVPLSEEEQYQIAPHPRACEESRLRRQAKELPH